MILRTGTVWDSGEVYHVIIYYHLAGGFARGHC
jgi:hypothetical protein